MVTWGNNGGGDSSSVASELSSGVSNIYSNEYAFAALKDDGSVVTWGNINFGGDSSSVASELSSSVSTIYSTNGAFAALKADGSVVTWGNINFGGDSSSVASELTSGVSSIYSNGGAFAAFYSPDLSSPILPLLENFYESTSGTTTEVDAIPTDGYPTNFSYQWYFNGFPVPSMFGGTNSAFTIDGSESSNGTWRVEVTNDAGTTSAEFEYRVFADADGDGLSDY